MSECKLCTDGWVRENDGHGRQVKRRCRCGASWRRPGARRIEIQRAGHGPVEVTIVRRETR